MTSTGRSHLALIIALLFLFTHCVADVAAATKRMRAKQNGILGIGATVPDAQCPVLPDGNGTTRDIIKDIGTFGQGLDDDADDLREEIEDMLEKNNQWTSSTDDYKNIVSRFRAILKVDREDLDDEISFDDDDMDLKAATCSFANYTQVPQELTECANTFKQIEPALINLVRNAVHEKTIPTLYWLLSTLDVMPQLSHQCLQKPFSIPEKDSDDDDCEEEVEHIADWMGEVERAPESMFNADLRIRVLIEEYIPRAVAYCLGIDNN